MISSKDCWMKDSCSQKGCPEFCIKLFKLDYLFNQALISDFQRKHIELFADQDGTDKDVFIKLKNIENNIENFVKDGKNIYMHSPISGNGKTAWSLRLMQSFFSSIWHKTEFECRGLYINVPRFLLSLKDNITHENDYVNHIKENVLNADFVIWDEVGVKSLTTFEHEHLLYFINTRIDYHKANIYTSNLNPNELRDKLGDRLYSRVVNNSIDFEFHGKDKRGI